MGVCSDKGWAEINKYNTQSLPFFYNLNQSLPSKHTLTISSFANANVELSCTFVLRFSYAFIKAEFVHFLSYLG